MWGNRRNLVRKEAEAWIVQADSSGLSSFSPLPSFFFLLYVFGGNLCWYIRMTFMSACCLGNSPMIWGSGLIIWFHVMVKRKMKRHDLKLSEFWHTFQTNPRDPTFFSDSSCYKNFWIRYDRQSEFAQSRIATSLGSLLWQHVGRPIEHIAMGVMYRWNTMRWPIEVKLFEPGQSKRRKRGGSYSAHAVVH